MLCYSLKFDSRAVQGLSAVALKENIWTFGGYDLRSGEKAVFSFNYTTNIWTQYPTPLQKARYGHRSGLQAFMFGDNEIHKF